MRNIPECWKTDIYNLDSNNSNLNVDVVFIFMLILQVHALPNFIRGTFFQVVCKECSDIASAEAHECSPHVFERSSKAWGALQL